MLETESYVTSAKNELFDALLASLDDEAQAKATQVFSRYRDDPCAFATDILGIEPTGQQSQILNGMVAHGHVAVRSGHGIGKSTALAILSLWFMSTRPNARIPVTAPTSHQLFDVYYSELISRYGQMDERYRDLFGFTSEKFFCKANPVGWAVYPRTARPEKPEALQGFHGKNLMFLIDEAAGVDDKIFEVAEGSLTEENNLVLMTGNPTRLTGTFYNSFHRDRDRWHCLHFSSEDSELVSDGYAERMAQKYGADSNIYRVRVLGEFPTSEEDQLISIDLLEAAVAREPVASDCDEILWGLDPARFGSDATALVKRCGDVVTGIKTRRNFNTMQTVGWVASQVEAGCDRPHTIFVDTIGIGAGIADRLREIGLPAVDVNVANKSRSPKYANLRAELWLAYRDWLAAGAASLPDDENLIAESSTIKYSFDSAGRIKIEKKEEMKRRGLPSPDRADALCLTFKKPGIFSKSRFNIF